MGKELIIGGKKINLEGMTIKKSFKQSLENVKPTHQDVDKAIIILLDGSDSMNEAFTYDKSGFGTSSRIQTAWKVFQHDLAPNLIGWSYGILIFQEASCSWLIYPTNDCKALTVTQTPNAFGYTPMGRALQTAWVWTKEHTKQARFILISDGMSNDASKEEIINNVMANKNIPIDTIGIGSEHSVFSYDKEFLGKISQLTGGKFYEVKDAVNLGKSVFELSPSQRPLLGTVK